MITDYHPHITNKHGNQDVFTLKIDVFQTPLTEQQGYDNFNKPKTAGTRLEDMAILHFVRHRECKLRRPPRKDNECYSNAYAWNRTLNLPSLRARQIFLSAERRK